MSLVELTDDQGSTSPAAPRPAAESESEALWLSASTLDLDAQWRSRSEAQPPASALAGRSLRDYWPIGLLGKGSHGEVWKAVSVAPRLQLVAIKVLRFDQAHRVDRRDRFRREAELAMRLRAPGILPVEECGEEHGVQFMVMPFVDGFTLADLLAERRGPSLRPLPGQDTRARFHLRSCWTGLDDDDFTVAMVRAAVRIARALEASHAERLVHRDVKPANILLDRSSLDRVYLADFGLGRDLDDPAPGPADGSGTPLYMAPERLLGREADEMRCDIYSLGVTLYEAVTLVHPKPVPPGLHRSCLPAYLAAIVPARPRVLRPDIPPTLETIIQKAIEREPSQRYASAAALADDLERWLNSSAPGPVEPAPRVRDRLGRNLRSDVGQPPGNPHAQENGGLAHPGHEPRYVLYPKGLSSNGM
jgi:serine/threonine-protein kinase